MAVFNERKKVNLFNEGDLIFSKDETPVAVYIVLNGSVNVVGQDENGQVKTSYTANTGELFGYRSLILEEPHSASAVAVQNSEICIMDKDNFLEMFARNVLLGAKFINFISSQPKNRKTINDNIKT